MQNTYMPEGNLIDTQKNIELTATVTGLEHAMQHGIILEGMAMLCDGRYDLHVSLGEVDGIIRRSDVAECRDGGAIKDIAVITRVGKPVSFKVVGFENYCGKKRALLSRRAAQAECYDSYLLTLAPGDIIPAKVTHLENFGAFVDIGCGIPSLLSVDCISVSRISHPADRLTCGMSIYTVIKSIDYDSGRIYVTQRELLGTWEENAAHFSPGQTVAGIIRSVEQYGIFVELTPNLAGLAELRELGSPFCPVIPGQWAAVYIKSIIPERMKIKLVLIDTHSGCVPPSPPEYYIDTSKVKRLNRWVYSPPSSQRVIETIFGC